MTAEELIIQACQDIQARDANYGDWPNGIPDSFKEICRQRPNLNEDMTDWVAIVETIVRIAAVKLIATSPHFQK